MNGASFKDAAISAFRVWIITTIGLTVPGLFGWINEVTKWAEQKGAPPFPDPTNLAFLFVAALTAAFPAAVSGLLRLVENGTGHNLLPRPAGPSPVPTPPDERGAGDLRLVLIIVAGVLIAMFLWALLR